MLSEPTLYQSTSVNIINPDLSNVDSWAIAGNGGVYGFTNAHYSYLSATEYMGYVNGNDSSMSQLLSENAVSDAIYTLTFDIANRSDQPVSDSGEVNLYAGTILLGNLKLIGDVNMTQGSSQSHTIIVDMAKYPDAIGLAMKIEIINSSSDAQAQFSFDNISLNAQTTNHVLAYNPNNGAQTLNANFVINEPDGSTIFSAKVKISDGYNSSSDALTFTPAHGITGSYDSSLGVLSLSGSATPEQYSAVLANVQYVDTSTLTQWVNKTVEWTVNDGRNSSSVFTSTLTSVSEDQGIDYGAYDASSATYNKNLSSPAIDPTGISFSSDGTKVYYLSYKNGNVKEVTLSTPYDISTGINTELQGLISDQNASQAISISSDGLTLLVAIDSNIDALRTYSLTTPNDISSINMTPSSTFSIGVDEPDVRGSIFNNDGTKIFFIGLNNTIFEYSLATAYDLSTTHSPVSNDISSKLTTSTEIAFSVNGDKLFVLDKFDAKIKFFDLTSPYSVANGLIYIGAFDISGQSANPHGLAISSDGSTILVSDVTTNEIYSYNINLFTDDSDKDGLINSLDIDNDGDGILDSVENTGINYGAYDVLAATYSGATAALGGTINPKGVAFNANGTKIYISDGTNGDILEYDLIIPFDISTKGVSASTTFDINDIDQAIKSFSFGSNGSTLLVVYADGVNEIREYALNIPYDLGSVNYSPVNVFAINSYETQPTGITFSTDGNLLFFTGVDSKQVHQVNLVSPFSLTGASYVNSPFSLTHNATGMAFSPDGSQMFILVNPSTIEVYTLSSPFDISLGVTFSNTFDTSAQESAPTGIAFNSDGSQLILTGSSSDSLYTYDIALFTNDADKDGVINSLDSDSDGDGIADNIESGSVQASAYDVTNASYSGSVSSKLSGNFYGIAFNSSGSKMYTSQTNSNLIIEYNLSLPFDPSTASANSSVNIVANNGSLQGISFSSDGHLMLVTLSAPNNEVRTYELSSAFDLSTVQIASVKVLQMPSGENLPTGAVFNSNGTKLFVTASDSNAILEYTLTTPYSFTSEVLTNTFDIASYSTEPRDVAFNQLGTMMVIVDQSGSIEMFTLATPFSTLSGVAYYGALDVSAQEQNPTAIDFGDNGTTLSVIGLSKDRVYSYDIPINNTDSDGDGLVDAYDSTPTTGAPGSNGVTPIDTFGDTTPDTLDPANISSVISLTANEGASTNSSDGGSVGATLNDSFNYNALDPTAAMPTLTYAGSGNYLFQSIEAEGVDVVLAYDLDSHYTQDGTNNALVIDLYGRDDTAQERDNNFDIEVFNASNQSLGKVSGLAIPDTATPHLRVDISAQLVPALADGATIANFKVIAHDSTPESGNYFALFELRAAEIILATPIILDLDGDGIETVRVENGVRFDIDGDGTLEQTGWVAADDALLVRDINRDGQINGAAELFGGSTQLADGSKAADGFAALADLDTNSDGVIDATDDAFAELQLWQDYNQDGLVDSGELNFLSDTQVASLSLAATAGAEQDNGNRLGLESSWSDEIGNRHDMTDVWFQYQELTPPVNNTEKIADLDLAEQGQNENVIDWSDFEESEESLNAHTPAQVALSSHHSEQPATQAQPLPLEINIINDDFITS